MAKTPKIAKAPKSFKSYALNKCLIGYGVVNGIINAAIFAGINAGAPDAMFGMHDIVHDLAFTGLLLGMLLFACVVPLTRMDLRKGVFSLPGAAGGAFPLVSSSYAVSILGVGALAAVVMTGAGASSSFGIARRRRHRDRHDVPQGPGVRFGRRGRRLVHHQLCGARPAEGRRGGGRHGLQDCRGSASGQSARIRLPRPSRSVLQEAVSAGVLCFERGAGPSVETAWERVGGPSMTRLFCLLLRAHPSVTALRVLIDGMDSAPIIGGAGRLRQVVPADEDPDERNAHGKVNGWLGAGELDATR